MYLENVLTLRVCSSLLTAILANLSLPRSTLARPWTPARAPGVPHRLCRWRALASSGELGTVFSREGTRPSVARPRLRGEAPARPRGPGGCTETARDVHRVHRHQGPHALPVGDHRQLRRRGACGLRRQDRGRAASRRVDLRLRPRPRHPSGHPPRYGAVRRRGRLYEAPRRRQVRGRRVQRHRRPARCRRVRGERVVEPSGRRGRPRRMDVRDELPARHSRHLRQRRPYRGVHTQVRAPQGRQGRQARHGHQGEVLAGPSDLPARRPAGLGVAAEPSPPDELLDPGSRDLGHGRPRTTDGQRDVQARRGHRRVLRIPGARRARHGHRPAARDRQVQRDRTDDGRLRFDDPDGCRT